MRRGHGTAILLLAHMLVWPVLADPVAPARSPPTRATPAPIDPGEPIPGEPLPTPNADEAPSSAALAPDAPAAASVPKPEPAARPDITAAKPPEPPAEAAKPEPDTAAKPPAPPAEPATTEPEIAAKPPEPPAEAAKPADDKVEAKAAAPAADEPPAKPADAADTPEEEAPAATPAGGPAPVAAKKLFGSAKAPANLAARAIGAYSRGCLAGAKPLPVDGPAWQAMRLSRNRTWGHPDLIALLEKFSSEVKEDGWPGLLVGDISQPRGGPMLTGHASHQVGLDADIWFTPMPDRRLSNKERETLSATSMLANDSLSVDPKVWTESRVKIIKRVASYSKIERVLVHPAIKKALCQAAGTDRHWLNKVRPYWGHFYHFHIRIGCPGNSPTCKPQAPIPGDDGCGKELDDWFKLLTRKPKPQPKPKEEIARKPVKPRIVTLDDLPAECRTVLATGSDIKLPPPAVAATHKPAATPAKSAATAPHAGKGAGAKAAATKAADKTKKITP